MSDELMPVSVSPIVPAQTQQNSIPGLRFKTIQVESVMDAMRIANAINSPDSLADIPNGTLLHVVDVIGMQGSRKARQEGYPDTPCTNTVFLLDDGTSLFTQSDGIARSMETICTILPDCGRSQGMAYMPIFISEKKLRSGNTLKVAELALDKMQ